GFLSLENPADIDAHLAERVRLTGGVAHQAAGRDRLALSEDGGNCVADRQRNDLLAPACEKRVGRHDERVGLILRNGREGGVQLAVFAARAGPGPRVATITATGRRTSSAASAGN